MKVISPGRKPDDTPLRGRCHTCETVIECLQRECTWMEDHPGDTNAAHGINCPTCGGWIYPVPRKDDPKLWELRE